ncbi:MAG: 30S ribosomal protein S15 [Candidatus Harrisonbacteria bacterium]|nr:30S ribosomal protein S15 [Candidatus Harrisonbacteria bacterium]
MLSPRQKKNVMKDISIHDKDTGSTGVQIGLITKSVNELVSHLKKNPKDNHSRRGLLKMVGKRRRLLKYMETHDEKGYKALIKKLDL